ncbi:hypothetical protein V6N13_058528 [Hibiscus sabdariffa]
MTEDGGAGGFSDGSTVSNDALQTRQRKKRKCDQPAEAFVSAGFTVPFNNLGGESLFLCSAVWEKGDCCS